MHTNTLPAPSLRYVPRNAALAIASHVPALPLPETDRAAGEVGVQHTQNITITAPTLHHRCSIAAPSLYHHCTITVPSLCFSIPNHHCTITAPSPHRHCTITVPSRSATTLKNDNGSRHHLPAQCRRTHTMNNSSCLLFFLACICNGLRAVPRHVIMTSQKSPAPSPRVR